MSFLSYDPKELKTAQLHDYMLSTICPRPIAWASTIDKDGNVNLAPFSFFNFFGSNPPIIIFSPSRRVRDNTTKHTLENVKETRECVINIVNYELAGQMMLTSAEYGGEINEFEKSNLTQTPSVRVKPPRVKESPAQYECIVKDVIATGEQGGSGSLIICEVVHLHLRDDIFESEGKIDPRRVDTIARMGRSWYTRASEGLFEMPNPVGKKVGFDRVPGYIRESRFLTGSDIGRLASIEYVPTEEELAMVKSSTGMQELISKYGNQSEELQSKVHVMAKTLVHENKLEEAWRLLMAFPGSPAHPHQGA
jgi:flavin reductase (DIM6/NTAB) family NADH-FMN oxidoreductase RutF